MTGPASRSGCNASRSTALTLVDRHRDYLRKRRAEEPGVPVQQLLREIRERGYQGSSNLLVRYINQGRLDSDRPHLSPRRAARILLTRPDRLTGGEAETLARIEAACPEMTALASLIRSFAQMLAPAGETRPGSSDGSSAPARLTCPTCTPSPGASTWTSRPPRRRSPSRITTAGPKESTPRPR
jgi:hypothetical protein